MMHGTKNHLTFLYLTFDGFADIWEFTLNRFLSNLDCHNANILLMTNEKVFANDRIQSLCIGKNMDWSDNLLCALDKIDSDYFITIFDDFLFTKPINIKRIKYFSQIFVENKMDYLRLRPEPYPDEKITTEYGRLSEGALYRVSLCTAIIKKEVLRNLLRKGENAWDFEFQGSIRSDEYKYFYSTYETVMPYINSIEKGRWRIEAVPHATQAGIDVFKRGIFIDKKNSVVQFIKNILLFRLIPAKYRRPFLALYQRLIL
jgi:hypothetical protein